MDDRRRRAVWFMNRGKKDCWDKMRRGLSIILDKDAHNDDMVDYMVRRLPELLDPPPQKQVRRLR